MSKLQDLASHVASLGRDAGGVSHQLSSLRTRVARLHDQLSGAARVGVDVRGVQRSIATSEQAVKAGAASAAQAAQLASHFANSLVAGAATGGFAAGGGAGTDGGGRGGSGGGAGGTSGLQSAEDIRGWIKDVNPNFNPSHRDAYWANCGSCAVSTLDGLMGNDVMSVGSRSYSPDEMASIIGKRQEQMTPTQIEQGLRDAGPGSAAVVGIDRAGGRDGHWFNAYYDGSDVYCVDGQTGTVTGWPPTFTHVSNWDAAIFSKESQDDY